MGGGVMRPCGGACLSSSSSSSSPWRPVTASTQFMIQSVTKAVCAAGALALVGRGKLDYDAPVSQYWPEFAAHGKGAMTVTARPQPPPHPKEPTEKPLPWHGMTAPVLLAPPLPFRCQRP